MQSPHEIIEKVERYLSDKNVPDYVAIQTLKKALESYPHNTDLQDRLKRLESCAHRPTQTASPRLLYGVLVVLITFLGLTVLYSYVAGHTTQLGLYTGIIFLIIAAIIFNQYRKEK
jgi:hypothetical protein